MKKQKKKNLLPRDLDDKKIAKIIAYYDARQDADLLSDPDHQPLTEPTSWVEIPTELVPAVKKFVARFRKSA